MTGEEIQVKFVGIATMKLAHDPQRLVLVKEGMHDCLWFDAEHRMNLTSTQSLRSPQELEVR